VRIVGGRWGGRRLSAPRGSATRPTSDRVREALFAVLADRVVGARVLDLCAGSGALGLEALSRGAAHVTFVERDRRTADVIRANAAALRVSPHAHRIRVEPARRALRDAAQTFDLVLCDPPWSDVSAVAADLFAAAPRLLDPRGLVVLEHRAGEAPPVPNGLRAVDARKYGDTALLVCAPAPETSP
jgi:16S rRNA (guanine(966)-N(2))-methyltransferase RsmD